MLGGTLQSVVGASWYTAIEEATEDSEETNPEHADLAFVLSVELVPFVALTVLLGESCCERVATTD